MLQVRKEKNRVSIIAWNIKDIIHCSPPRNQTEHNFDNHYDWKNKVTAFAISPAITNEKIYAVGFQNGDICLTSLSDNASRHFVKVGIESVKNISFSADGNRFITDSDHTYIFTTCYQYDDDGNANVNVYSQNMILKTDSVMKKSVLLLDHTLCLNKLGTIERYKNDIVKSIHNYHEPMIGLSTSADRSTVLVFSHNTIIVWCRDGAQRNFNFSGTFEEPISNVFITSDDHEIIIQAKNLFRFNISTWDILPKTIRSCDSCIVAVSQTNGTNSTN